METSSKTISCINHIQTGDQSYAIDLSDDIKDRLFDMFMKKLSVKPVVQYKCHNCGANVEMDADKHIFICKYCGSVYAVGTKQIYDRG